MFRRKPCNHSALLAELETLRLAYARLRVRVEALEAKDAPKKVGDPRPWMHRATVQSKQNRATEPIRRPT